MKYKFCVGLNLFKTTKYYHHPPFNEVLRHHGILEIIRVPPKSLAGGKVSTEIEPCGSQSFPGGSQSKSGAWTLTGGTMCFRETGNKNRKAEKEGSISHSNPGSMALGVGGRLKEKALG